MKPSVIFWRQRSQLVYAILIGSSFQCSYEAGILEEPNQTPPDDMWTMTNDPLKAPNEPVDLTISFQQGIPIKLATPEKTFTSSVQLFKELNRIGKLHGTCKRINDLGSTTDVVLSLLQLVLMNSGIGRIDIVEIRFIGLKSRGCYDVICIKLLRTEYTGSWPMFLIFILAVSSNDHPWACSP